MHKMSPVGALLLLLLSIYYGSPLPANNNTSTEVMMMMDTRAECSTETNNETNERVTKTNIIGIKNDDDDESFLQAHHLWPSKTVIYELHPELTSAETLHVMGAMEEISSKTCIHFRPKAPSDKDYTTISVDNSSCGQAHVCRQGGQQHTKFGGACRSKSVMIHELMHTLCFAHEHARPDRDDYVTFDHCLERAPKEAQQDSVVDNYPYDYYSRMHYTCDECPGGGWPTRQGVEKCGRAITPGLGVMDADKVNDLYDCRGCFSHRWRLTTSLTSTQISTTMLTFDSGKTGICRGFILGNLVIGSYSGGSCVLSSGGEEHVVVADSQVLTSRSNRELNYYRLVNVTGVDPKVHTLIAAAKKGSDGRIGFVGVWSLDNYPSSSSSTGVIKVYGTVWDWTAISGNYPEMYFPFQGEEHKSTNFFFLVCTKRRHKLEVAQPVKKYSEAIRAPNTTNVSTGATTPTLRKSPHGRRRGRYRWLVSSPLLTNYSGSTRRNMLRNPKFSTALGVPTAANPVRGTTPPVAKKEKQGSPKVRMGSKPYSARRIGYLVGTGAMLGVILISIVIVIGRHQ